LKSNKRTTSKSPIKSKTPEKPQTPEKPKPIISEPDPKENECPICMELFQNTYDIILTKCNHKFHMNCLYDHCIHTNNVIKKECPMCRGDIIDTCNEIIKKKKENTLDEPIDINAYCKSKNTDIISFLDFSAFGDNKRSPKEIKDQLKNLTYNPHWKSCKKDKYNEEIIIKDKHEQILEKIRCWVEQGVEIK